MRNFWIICALLVAVGNPIAAKAAEKLSLDEAIQIALQNSPTIQGAEADYGIAKGERRQAGALPNPSIGFEAENIAGTGSYKGVDSAEMTIGVSQEVPIGGKLSARMKAADQGKVAAKYGQSTAKLDLIRDVKQAFAEAVTAQEQMVITDEQAKLARDVYNSVNKRVSAAAEPIVQRNKAKISLANAELAAENAKGQKNAAFKKLVTLLNGASLPTALDTEGFYKATKLEIDANTEELLKNTPDYKFHSANVEQSKSLLDLEKANAIPDPNFSVGLRDFRGGNDQALVAGVSIPLPVFNLNGGNIQKARYQAVKADVERQKLLLSGQASLAEHVQQTENAYLTATRINQDILPQAQEAFVQAKRGYNAGKFAYLEVLDAQRTLSETRLSYVQALRDFHVNSAEVERLTAQDDISQGAKS